MYSSGALVRSLAHKCLSKKVFGILILCFFTAAPAHADIIAAWDFNDENLLVDYGSGTFTSTDSSLDYLSHGSNYYPNIRRVGISYGVANSCGWEVRVSTRNFENITISFKASLAGKGPKQISLLYSADEGSTWFEFLNWPWLGASWLSYNQVALASNLDVNNVANDCADLRIRYIATGDGLGGNNHLDDLVIEGTHAPEPSAMAIIILGGLLLARRGRNGHRG